MCILFWTVDNHPKYRFVFAGNRDEFLKRPTARAHFWNEPNSHVLAGTDLEAGNNGTWLGITKQGRFAALTNFREHDFRGTTSRGVLVRDFLLASGTVQHDLSALQNHQEEYGGFSLVCFDFGKKDAVDMAYITNRQYQSVIELKPGEIYGLSNSILTKPWPKVNEGKILFESILRENNGDDQEDLIENLFSLLSTTKPMCNVHDLNQVFKDLSERICIPKFDFPVHSIKEPAYATRTSTVVLVDHNDNVTFVEREWHGDDENTFPPPPTDQPGGNYHDIVYHFKLEPQ